MANDSRTLFYRAQIECLIFATRVAIQTGDTDAFTVTSGKLHDLVENMDVPAALRDTAFVAHQNLAFAMTDAGLQQMKRIVEQLNGATSDLDAAIRVATDGKKRLFLPALAQSAADLLTKFNALQTAIAAIDAGLEHATEGDLKDVPNKLQALVADLEKLKPVFEDAA